MFFQRECWCWHAISRQHVPDSAQNNTCFSSTRPLNPQMPLSSSLTHLFCNLLVLLFSFLLCLQVLFSSPDRRSFHHVAPLLTQLHSLNFHSAQNTPPQQSMPPRASDPLKQRNLNIARSIRAVCMGHFLHQRCRREVI